MIARQPPRDLCRHKNTLSPFDTWGDYSHRAGASPSQEPEWSPQVLCIAAEEAAASGHSSILPAHLLIGLCRVVDLASNNLSAGMQATQRRLRRELEAARAPSTPAVAPEAGANAQGPVQPVIEQRVAKLEEDQALLNDKVEDQYQTKVESASKYRVRLSGIALFNLFNDVGAVDNQDFPAIAVASGPLVPAGGFGATLRQSELGFEAFGPERLMIGSDWPVCLLSGSYDQVIGALQAILNPNLNESQKAAVFGGNAGRFYKL